MLCLSIWQFRPSASQPFTPLPLPHCLHPLSLLPASRPTAATILASSLFPSPIRASYMFLHSLHSLPLPSHRLAFAAYYASLGGGLGPSLRGQGSATTVHRPRSAREAAAVAAAGEGEEGEEGLGGGEKGRLQASDASGLGLAGGREGADTRGIPSGQAYAGSSGSLPAEDEWQEGLSRSSSGGGPVALRNVTVSKEEDESALVLCGKSVLRLLQLPGVDLSDRGTRGEAAEVLRGLLHASNGVSRPHALLLLLPMVTSALEVRPCIYTLHEA